MYHEIHQDLPADYIIEYHNTNDLPTDYFKTANGWEIETEEHFNIEFAKNETLLETFKLEQHEKCKEQKRIVKDQVNREYIASREDFKLYLEFLEWKNKMKTQHYNHNANR